MPTMRCWAVLLWVAALSAPAWAADRVSADAYLAGVPAALNSGDYKTVEDLCKRSLKADETCPAAHFFLGSGYEKENKPREAFKEYQAAANYAAKEKDTVTASKASAAAKRLGQGLIDMDAADQKLAEKLSKLAAEALDAGQLETAKQAYAALAILQPDSEKIKEGLDRVNKEIDARGDPIRSKVAMAMLSEMWYKYGDGKKDDATELAKQLSSKFKGTEWGREATDLLDRDFAAPKKEEVAQLSKKLKDNAKKAPPKTPASPATPSTPSTPSTVAAKSVEPGRVDVEALEKAADENTQKLAKDALVPAFKDAYQKGKSHYSKATPGSAGNQENVAKALEHFIKADSLYIRIEAENLSTPELAANVKEASMLRYACMKMTILSH